MQLPDNMSYNFDRLSAYIEEGSIQIPQFQRDFVWNLNQSAKLIDSILKGYPIGNFIFWETKESMRTLRSIGNLTFQEVKEGDSRRYVLDGQQRITSIYAALKGVKINLADGKEVDYSKIFIDFEAGKDDDVVITDVEGKDQKTYIKVSDLFASKIAVVHDYHLTYGQKVDGYRDKLIAYNFAITLLNNASIDVATEVFTRLNVGGRTLSLFEIMVAKTYDANKKFDLAEKYADLRNDLSAIQYDTIPNITVLQVVSALISKECTRKRILTLDKNEIIDIWDAACSAIKDSVDFFRDSYRIPVSRLLPYNALIVIFSYYFYKKGSRPTGEEQRKLEDLFWNISLGYRYSSSTESKLAQDIDRVEKIIAGKDIKYDWSIEIEPEQIKAHGEFRTSRSYIKAILAIMAYERPKDFHDNSLVNIRNDNLKISTSRNYHHFFPKSYMAKNRSDVPYWACNHILNITMIGDFPNKSLIKSKPPSVYIGDFMKTNDQIKDTMKTHLINDIDSWGILEDDFDKFIDKRANIISNEIKNRLISYKGKDESDTANYYASAQEEDDDE